MRAFLAASAVIAAAAVSYAQPPTWTEHEVTIARLCVNEASWNVDDCAAITEARARYSVPQLRQMHPRALAPYRSDGRRWIGTLDADGSMPDGWPESEVSWETRGLPSWLRVLATVRQTMRGVRVCDARPSVWGGIVLDRERIHRLEQRGYVRVNCGSTRNVYLRRGGS